jgi:hypothetical protein
MVLLSASDKALAADGMARIERLYNLDGSSKVGIVFLLHEAGKENTDDGMTAYMELQAKYERELLL